VVCDAVTHRPVQGAQVVVLGTRIGAFGDGTGLFALTIPDTGFRLIQIQAPSYKKRIMLWPWHGDALIPFVIVRLQPGVP
jgi:hypothetical protein